ncbi:MAG TPA: hypothetical protein VFK81_13415 [Terriglobales bacterium]|jgi:hypothetical protein|nr:hypothetical protein [Terriglobales bacterium]
MKKLQEAGATFMAALREIFDEAAYRRFLQRTRQPASRSSYRDFLRQRMGAKPRPRCC